jgi:hypothetical protein
VPYMCPSDSAVRLRRWSCEPRMTVPVSSCLLPPATADFLGSDLKPRITQHNMAPRTALPLPPTLPGSEPDPPPPDIAPRPDKHVQFRASSPPITSSDHSTQQEIASPSNQDDLARSSSDHSTNMREAEESPLLPSQEEEEHAILPHVPSPSRSSSETWIGQDTGEGESKSSLYLFLLTIAFGG